MKDVQKIITEVKWINIGEENFYKARRDKILPRLVYFDEDGNVYHYILKKFSSIIEKWDLE